jgi:hypothetical protein
MKTQGFQKPLLVITAVLWLSFLAGNAVAQDSSTAAMVTSKTVLQLSYGVAQIVQLSQAKVNDGTIITYIQNSGNGYGLDANQVIYLHQQGVSVAVINTMLNQRNIMAAAAQTASQATTAPPQQSYSDTVVQPTMTAYVPPSTVYIIPDTQTYRYNAYYYQPYYYPYYAWPYPAVPYSFGFRGRWGGGYYHGGGVHRY